MSPRRPPRMSGSTTGARQRPGAPRASPTAAPPTPDHPISTPAKEAIMTDRIDRKLSELGLALPAPAAPIASYVPAVEAGGLLHISGQLPFRDGAVMTGRLGDDKDLAYGQEAAQRCAQMLVAQMKAALGGLHRDERIVKLGVFINSAGDFTDQPQVANGASDLMVALFGDAGKHARSAVGVPTLPRGAAVEVDAIVQIAAV